MPVTYCTYNALALSRSQSHSHRLSTEQKRVRILGDSFVLPSWRFLSFCVHLHVVRLDLREWQSGDEMSKRTKFLFVTWLGPNVSTMKRARLSSDKALVKEIIMVLIKRDSILTYSYINKYINISFIPISPCPLPLYIYMVCLAFYIASPFLCLCPLVLIHVRLYIPGSPILRNQCQKAPYSFPFAILARFLLYVVVLHLASTIYT